MFENDAIRILADAEAADVRGIMSSEGIIAEFGEHKWKCQAAQMVEHVKRREARGASRGFWEC